MLREILAWLFDKLRWLLRWYFDKVATSWQWEVRRLGNRDNKWLWIVLCIVYTLFLLPYLAQEAFSTSIMLGLAFLSSAFLVVSFGYILWNPMLLIVLYVLVIFRRELSGFFGIAKDTAMGGDILGAIILVGLAIYLIWKTTQIEREFR